MEESKHEKESTEMEETPKDVTDDLERGDGVQNEIDKLQKELLYLRAEFDNSKKRLLKEQEQAIKYGNEKIIRDLLGPLDLLERALTHGKKLTEKADAEVVNFYNGIQMTHRELIQVLTRLGVEFVGNENERFDPNRHEAISQVEGEQYTEDTVIQVFQKGCLLHGRLLSPARVAVGKPKK